MFYLVKVLIGRAVVALDRPFSYYSEDDSLQQGMRVLVSFGSSKETVAFIVEKPVKIEMSLDEYQAQQGMKLSKILSKIDSTPLLDEEGLELAKRIASYYQCDLIKVLSAMLPPSLKPKNSALNKAQGKFVDFVFSLPFDINTLSKNERELYQKVSHEEDGIRYGKITAKKALASLLEKKALEVREIPVSRIPELEVKKLIPVDLTKEQQEAKDGVLQGEQKVYLLQGVTGSGKTEVYISLAEECLKQGKGVLVLIPEIALTDRMSILFASHFKDTISILNSSLSDARKYDEYQRIHSGESLVVLGTRSAIFAPVQNLGLIIIDEEHASTYKQDSTPYYDAIQVALMRSELSDCKILLGSATPRVIDKARAMKNVYHPLYMKQRIAPNQDKEILFVDMNDSSIFDPKVSSFYSKTLIDEIAKTLEAHQQALILINRRGYSPIYYCRNCQKAVICPNCNIPLSHHKRDDSLRCHHCGYRVSTIAYQCPTCKGNDFTSLGFGTERALEDLKMLFPKARIARLDSDIASNNVRHETLEAFANGEFDIVVGTEVIAKGHDFPKVTLAAMLDADCCLKLPTYLANEETFDLISQFVGRAGRGKVKGRVLLQTYVPDNIVIQLAAKQDYETFYSLEMEERRKYQYPPYTFLTNIIIKGMEQKRVEDVALKVKDYLMENIKGRKFNLYGPTIPYIAHINGRYYRTILLKYKNQKEASELLSGIKVLRLANKDVDISIDVDPGSEAI